MICSISVATIFIHYTNGGDKVSFTKMIDHYKEVLLEPELWESIAIFVFKIILIIVIASIIVKIGKMIIQRLLKLKAHTKLRPSERREQTLVKLLENVLTYVIYFSAILAILGEFNVDVRGVLASAGVLGLAVGFGAQSLVKDIISGFFIIFEDQFAVGDYVQIGEAQGTVLEIGLRTTKCEAVGGEIYIIPNGNITEVINFSINHGIAIMEVRIAYENNIEKVEDLLNTFLETLPAKYEELLETPTLAGVQDLTSTDIVYRVTAKTLPAMQWAFGRSFRKELKLFLDQNEIHVPYPKMVTLKEVSEENK